LYTNYTALRQCFHTLAEFADESGYSIAIPCRIGCVRGGGDWDGHVKPMIEKVFKDTEVYVCEYPPKYS